MRVLGLSFLAEPAFGDDVRIEGVTETPLGPAILTSQPFIVGDCAPQDLTPNYQTQSRKGGANEAPIPQGTSNAQNAVSVSINLPPLK